MKILIFLILFLYWLFTLKMQKFLIETMMILNMDYSVDKLCDKGLPDSVLKFVDSF